MGFMEKQRTSLFKITRDLAHLPGMRLFRNIIMPTDVRKMMAENGAYFADASRQFEEKRKELQTLFPEEARWLSNEAAESLPGNQVLLWDALESFYNFFTPPTYGPLVCLCVTNNKENEVFWRAIFQIPMMLGNRGFMVKEEYGYTLSPGVSHGEQEAIYQAIFHHLTEVITHDNPRLGTYDQAYVAIKEAIEES